jgi:hypothetical protein
VAKPAQPHASNDLHWSITNKREENYEHLA